MFYAQTHDPKPPDLREYESWLRELLQLEFPKWSPFPPDAWDHLLSEYRNMQQKPPPQIYNIKTGLPVERMDPEHYFPLSRNVGRYFQALIEPHNNKILVDGMPPNAIYSLIVITRAFFTWLMGPNGTEWLLKIFRIEEVEPHHGYRYWYGGRPRSNEATLIGEETDSTLRIFLKHSITRYCEPAYEEPGAVEGMKTLIQKANLKKVRAVKIPSDAIWKWALTALMHWFTEPADKTLPYANPHRISGAQWARNLKDPESSSDTMWSCIEMTDKYSPRAYRITQNGGVVWCGKSSISSEPLDVFDHREGVKAIRLGVYRSTEDQHMRKVMENYRCSSCERVLCCVTKIQGHRGGPEELLCDNCFGKQIERGDRDTLDNCTYTECGEQCCPNFIRGVDNLKNIKRRLAADYSMPVRR